jgi:hypothetical protein
MTLKRLGLHGFAAAALFVERRKARTRENVAVHGAGSKR